MAIQTAIEWTDATWNPVTGCSKTSPGCDRCYAERFAERFRGTQGHVFARGFDLQLRPERVLAPLKWRKPQMIFVNSMSDLFHKGIPQTFIDSVFDTMEKANWHVFQVLTKRSSLMLSYLRNRYTDRAPPAHLWFGVSIEDGSRKIRAKHLREAPAAVRFLSIEPLIGPLGIVDLKGMNWVIVGGESGPGARPLDPAWVRDVRDQCLKSQVAFFFKQWGGARPKSGGRLLDGQEWSQFPESVDGPSSPSRMTSSAGMQLPS